MKFINADSRFFASIAFVYFIVFDFQYFLNGLVLLQKEKIECLIVPLNGSKEINWQSKDRQTGVK